MSTNRVEELEATVAELQSTVQGLTEELVESKERIRVLEAELDTETPTRVPPRRQQEISFEAEPDDVEAATAEPDESAADPTAEEEKAQESGTDEIIIA